MVGIFRANNPFNTFLLFIYGLLLKFAFFSNAATIPVKVDEGTVFGQIDLKIQQASVAIPFIYPVIVFLLLFTQAVAFNRLFNDQRFIQKPTYLPAMSYLLVTSMFAEWNVLTPALVLNTFLIWIFGKLNNLYNNANPKALLFNTGMVTGLSAFIYFPSLGFAMIIISALIMNRPFNLAEWIVALIGIVTPFYLLFAWLYLTDRLNQFKTPALFIGYPKFNQNYWPLIAIGLLVVVFLTGAFFVQSNLNRQVVQVRKSWSLVLLYLAVSILVTFINSGSDFTYWILTAVPLSAFAASAFFYPVKRWLPLLLHWLMVAFVIATSYFLR